MVTGNGVTNESPRLVGHKVEKPKRVEARQGAVVRLPFPVEKTRVRTAIGYAILVTIHDHTTRAIRIDWSQRVSDPFPREQITLLHLNI